MRKVSIEQTIRDHLSQKINDEDTVNAVMHMHAWIDGDQHGPRQSAQAYGLNEEELRQYDKVSLLGLNAVSNPALNETLIYLNSKLPLAQDELTYHLDCELGIIEHHSFSAYSLMNAIEAYGLDAGFVPVSKDLHRWFVDPTDQRIVAFAESWLPELVKRVEHDVIIHVAQLEKLIVRVIGGYSLEQFWQAIHACPRLSTGTYPYVFAIQPDRNSSLLKRVDRLLSWAHPESVPVGVAYRQVYRDQSDSYIFQDPKSLITRQQVFSGFLLQCAYYDVWLQGASLLNDVPVDEVLSDHEKVVVEHLLSNVEGVDIDDIEDFARACRLQVGEVKRILFTSPVIRTNNGSVYSVLDPAELEQGPSPWEDENRFPFWQVSIESDSNLWGDDEEEPTALGSGSRTEDESESQTSPVFDVEAYMATLRQQLATSDIVDLAKLSRRSWLGVYTGALNDATLAQIEATGQHWTPVVEQESKICVGVVRTTRLRNKLTSGRPSIFANDPKMQGVELSRFVGRAQLGEALSRNTCVYFNDGPQVWGVVFQSDL